MAISLKLLSIVLFFCILSIGDGQQCNTSSIVVNTRNTGKRVGLDFVFEVEVKNQCQCTVTNVRLSSNGFMSSIQVDPKLFRLEGDHYIVNDGKGIPSSGSFKFSYAWDHWWKISPAGLQVSCLSMKNMCQKLKITKVMSL